MKRSRTKGQSSGAALPSSSSVKKVEVSAIAIPNRPQNLNEDVVEQLIASIERAGLLSPLLVTPLPRSDSFLLIAGVHRLEALQRLGRQIVEVIVREGEPHEVEMDQLEENLARKQLSTLERALQELRLSQLYATHYPNTVRGVAGALARHGAANEKFSFAKATARPGSGERIIQKRINLAKNLAPEAAVLLMGTPIANHQKALTGLSQLKKDEQLKVASVLAQGKTKKVDEAVKLTCGLPLIVRPPRVGRVTVPLKGGQPSSIATASFLGRKVTIEISDGQESITLSDVGRAAPHRGYPDDTEGLTRESLSRVLTEVISELPSSIAKDIEVSPQKEHTWLVECDIITAFPNSERSRGMRLAWWTEGGSDHDAAILRSSGPSPSIPVEGHLSGPISKGKFRTEFRQFFSRHVLKSTHHTTDVFGAVEKTASKAAEPKKRGTKKAEIRASDTESRLKKALEGQGFKASAIKQCLKDLQPRIEAGEDLSDLIRDAIQVLAPPVSPSR